MAQPSNEKPRKNERATTRSSIARTGSPEDEDDTYPVYVTPYDPTGKTLSRREEEEERLSDSIWIALMQHEWYAVYGYVMRLQEEGLDARRAYLAAAQQPSLRDFVKPPTWEEMEARVAEDRRLYPLKGTPSESSSEVAVPPLPPSTDGPSFTAPTARPNTDSLADSDKSNE